MRAARRPWVTVSSPRRRGAGAFKEARRKAGFCFLEVVRHPGYAVRPTLRGEGYRVATFARQAAGSGWSSGSLGRRYRRPGNATGPTLAMGNAGSVRRPQYAPPKGKRQQAEVSHRDPGLEPPLIRPSPGFDPCPLAPGRAPAATSRKTPRPCGPGKRPTSVLVAVSARTCPCTPGEAKNDVSSKTPGPQAGGFSASRQGRPPETIDAPFALPAQREHACDGVTMDASPFKRLGLPMNPVSNRSQFVTGVTERNIHPVPIPPLPHWRGANPLRARLWR